MPQELYTGQGFRAPQMGDRALQALTQFGRQEQQRKTTELKQAFADRDRIAELMKIDPVYTTNLKANQRIAKILDDSLDRMTSYNSQREGPLSAKDLSELQRIKSEAMAEMQMLKGASDQLTQAYALYAKEPWKYDKELLDTWREELERSLDDGVGLPPDGPALLPAINNPLAQADKAFQGMNFKYDDVTQKVVDLPGDKQKHVIERVWDTRGYTPESFSSMLMSLPNIQYHIQGWFDREVPDPEKIRLLNLTNGDASAAANRWFYEKTKDRYFGKMRREEEKPRRGYMGYEEKEEQKTYFSRENPNIYVFDGDPAYQKGYQRTAISGEGEGFALLNPELINIPADELEFNVPGISFDKGARIWVRPQQVLFKNNKIEYAVDPTRNGEVWATAKEEEEVPIRFIEDSVEQPDGTIKYLVNLKALAASGSVDVARPLIGKDFGEVYDQWMSQFSPEEKKPTTQKLKASFKWLNPLTWFEGETKEAVFEINGEQYTEQELRDGGWTDAQIEELKKQSNE